MIHHILLIQDGENPDDARRVDAPGFDDALLPVNLIVGRSTIFVARAYTQSGEFLPVTFTWRSGDPLIASVNNGRITGNDRGGTNIVVSADDRGIEVNLGVVVHNPVTSIVITGDIGAHQTGSEVTLTATAHDTTGNQVPGVSFIWGSSDSNVVAVEANPDDSSEATVSMRRAGDAEITARSGAIVSDPAQFTVFDIVQPERRIVVDTSNAPFNRYYHPAIPGMGTGAKLTPDGDAATANSDIEIRITIQVRVGGIWNDVSAGVPVLVESSDTSVLTVPAMLSTDNSGMVTLTINAGDAIEGQGNALGDGRAIVRFGETYSSDKHVEVTLQPLQ